MRPILYAKIENHCKYTHEDYIEAWNEYIPKMSVEELKKVYEDNDEGRGGDNQEWLHYRLLSELAAREYKC